MQVQMVEAALEAAKRPEPITESAACRIAQESYSDARDDLKRFQNLVYITACVAVAFVIAAIVLVALGSSTRGAGIVAFVGTAVTGLGVKFVKDQRDDARKAKGAAEKLVRSNCKQDAHAVEHLEAGEAVTV